MLTLQSLRCLEGCYQASGPIWNYAAGPLMPLEEPNTLLNQILLSITMQVVKQPVHWAASHTEEQDCSYFQINIGSNKFQIYIFNKDTLH